MHPLLFNIFGVPVHTYGFLIAVGFLVAVNVIKRLAVRSKLDVEATLDLVFWTLLVGFAGARLLFIFTRLDYFVTAPLDVFKVWEGGLVFFGGPLAAIPFVIYWTKKKKLPLWETMDAMIPGLAIAHVFGRFGCLAAGCCYGKPTGSEFGIKLDSELVDASLRGINLHPTQLYEAGAVFALFMTLLYVFKHRKFAGQVVLTYFMAYPIIRSVIEAFRGDLIRGFVVEDILSTSQFISLLLFLAATAVLMWRLKRVR